MRRTFGIRSIDVSTEPSAKKEITSSGELTFTATGTRKEMFLKFFPNPRTPVKHEIYKILGDKYYNMSLMRTILTSELKRERCNAAALGLYNAAVAAGDGSTDATWSDDAKIKKKADNFKDSIKSYLYDEHQYNELAYPGTQSKVVDDLLKRMTDNVRTLAITYNMSENEVIGHINAYSDPTTRKEWFIKFKKKLSKTK